MTTRAKCEIRWCISQHRRKAQITVNEIIDDGSYLTYICQPCAEAIGVREGDDLPDSHEVLKRLKQAQTK